MTNSPNPREALEALRDALKDAALNLDACAVAIKRGGKSNDRHVLVEGWAERAREALAKADAWLSREGAGEAGWLIEEWASKTGEFKARWFQLNSEEWWTADSARPCGSPVRLMLKPTLMTSAGPRPSRPNTGGDDEQPPNPGEAHPRRTAQRSLQNVGPVRCWLRLRSHESRL